MNKKELMELQEIQVEILGVVHDFCVKNDIKYQIYAGTLLGAVRHHGFIPWDDDIDIAMFREDYNKFLKLTNGQIANNYFVQNYQTDPEFTHQFTRVRKDNTLMLQDVYKEKNIHHGVFIDVFPLDAFPDSKLQQSLFLGKLRMHLRFRHSHNPEYAVYKGYFKKLVKNAIFKFADIFPKLWLDNLAEKTRSKYSSASFKKYGEFVSGLSDAFLSKVINNKSLYEDLRLFKFESLDVYGPKRYDELLSNRYGDYMSYPPEEARVQHHGVIVFSKHSNKKRGK